MVENLKNKYMNSDYFQILLEPVSAWNKNGALEYFYKTQSLPKVDYERWQAAASLQLAILDSYKKIADQWNQEDSSPTIVMER